MNKCFRRNIRHSNSDVPTKARGLKQTATSGSVCKRSFPVPNFIEPPWRWPENLENHCLDTHYNCTGLQRWLPFACPVNRWGGFSTPAIDFNANTSEQQKNRYVDISTLTLLICIKNPFCLHPNSVVIPLSFVGESMVLLLLHYHRFSSNFNANTLE